jgi:hypothetical protein
LRKRRGLATNIADASGASCLNYAFVEKRAFSSKPIEQTVTFGDQQIGLPIREDILLPEAAEHLARLN